MEKVFEGPVIIYNLPVEVSHFSAKLNSDGNTTQSMELLVPRNKGYMSLASGSAREDNL